MNIGPNTQELLKSIHSASDKLREELLTLNNVLEPVLLVDTDMGEDSVKELSPINTPLNVELSIVLNDLIVATNYILSMKNKINL
jgi:hypothetical protein